jgi:hypothetical protein
MTVASRSARHDRDRGMASAELALAIGLIMLPVTLLVLSVVQWPEREGIATGAAAEGARAAALAESPDAARSAMTARVSEVVAAAGIDPATVVAELSGEFVAGGHVTVSVTIELPPVEVPLLGTWAPGTHTASVTERVELHRRFDS